MYEIIINNQRKITVEGGSSLLATLAERKIFIPTACGGKAICGLCKVKVFEGGGKMLDCEKPLLSEDEIKDKFRLSCQVKVNNDLRIEIPSELLSTEEFVAKCTEIKSLTHDIKQFRLEFIEPKTMDYVPGQYVQLLSPVYNKGIEEVYRAYSISSDPADKSAIELIIRRMPGGICTTYCFEYLKVGDTVRINGPYGEFGLSDSQAPIVFIAGGSGMAPIKCMLYYIKNSSNKRKITYYFGANKVNDLFQQELMHSFESEIPNFKFVPVVASPESNENWNGEKGLVTEVVRRNVKNAYECEGYLCGSPGMIDAAIKVLMELGMSKDKIFYDKFE